MITNIKKLLFSPIGLEPRIQSRVYITAVVERYVKDQGNYASVCKKLAEKGRRWSMIGTNRVQNILLGYSRGDLSSTLH